MAGDEAVVVCPFLADDDRVEEATVAAQRLDELGHHLLVEIAAPG